MSVVNNSMAWLFDALLLPFRGLPPAVPLTLISLVLAVVMLLVYKHTSDQRRIAQTKAKIHAGLFEIRLFSDDPAAILRAQGDILRYNAAYFGLSLVPLAWMIVPLVLAFGQLQFQFGYRGFEPGDVTLVRAQLDEDWRSDFAGVAENERPPVSLEAPAGVEVLTPAVWLPSRNEVMWRVAVRQEGDHTLAVKLGDVSYEKSLRARGGTLRRSPVRPGGSLVDQVLYPAEAPLPKGPLTSIEVQYPSAGETAGIPHWMLAVFGLSIAFGFAIKDRLGVTI